MSEGHFKLSTQKVIDCMIFGTLHTESMHVQGRKWKNNMRSMAIWVVKFPMENTKLQFNFKALYFLK